ncbi:alpha-1,2-mannosyltransferase ktr1 [Coemansia biformis]|uniref:Alpha-1,2-mannosyltransferase ktr1 n=1 Tax=Coemansia biformis TaxID=1286918 RepID=A0A9W8CWM1_9FUNG|nr:alpha-1,2-mannosyltransferase ktr1 [Coemansia biformis]
MGLPHFGTLKPTARMYKLVVLLAALLALCFTMWMASSLLGTGYGRGIPLPSAFGGTRHKVPLEVGRLPSVRVSYDKPAPGERVNGAIVVLVRNSELQGLRGSMRMLEDRFNRRYGYPYVLLNDEEFTQEFRDGIATITKNEVRYGVLNSTMWGYSPTVTPEETRVKLEENKDRYLYGGSLSYRFMCRFQSGMFFHHPLVRDLDWYWRLEPDVKYFCDIDYDPFVYMRDNGFKYGFTIAPREIRSTVETLWYHTREWVKKHTHLLPEKSLANWVMGTDGHYNMCHFWSNFEIVDLSLYRSEAYRTYFEHLDRAGGFFYERWGAAPIHSIAAALLLNKDQVHWFEDIGYEHPGNMHCPRDAVMHARCVCDPARSYTYRSACQTRFAKVNNMQKARFLQLIHQSEPEYASVAESVNI